MANIVWQKTSRLVGLAQDAVHIWRAALDQWTDDPAKILAAEEQQRGRRFLRGEHRRRFCLARAYLRLILGRYLATEPARIRFREGAYGKLYLADQQLPLEFNVSHSEDLALYAVTLGSEIGIDVEWMNPALDIPALAARVFTPLECQMLLALPAPQQIPAFYRLWTRKEAYLKALGLGLSGLSLTHDEDAEQLMTLEPGPGYAGALALTGGQSLNPARISYFEINSPKMRG